MVEQVMRVLRLFTPERPELGVTEAAELLERPKSTVSRWLAAMHRGGLLARDPDTSLYRLSLSLAAMGEVARASTSLQRVARPLLETLVERTGETSNLVVLDGHAAVNVEVVRSRQAVQHVGVLGRRLPLHATAAGKALLAWAPEGIREEALCGPLRPLASRTQVNPAALMAELEQVRVQGYATAAAELEEELAAVSAPIRDHRGEVVAAVTTSAPISRMTPDHWKVIIREVTTVAGQISAELGLPIPHSHLQRSS